MGRIEDALAKLQSGAAGNPPRPQLPLARVSDAIAVTGPQQHNYGGKFVEVDFRALRTQGLLAPDAQERKLEDEYRVIKRPLIKNASSTEALERGNLLMVASANSGEGKTFTCVNLCLSIAREKDWTVVLVDGDGSKPHLTRLFGAEKQPGFSDLLRDPNLSVEELVMPTNVPCFSLLPAGSHDPNMAEFLASARMEAVCEALARSDPRRMIVFDSSPLLMTTEAAVLASQVGQIVMIVQADKTPHQAVLGALSKLDPSKAVNLVLNQSTQESMPAYGDYYGYGGQPEA
jgi:exopolysaccharide/PEP-CTERM locus tyrosine autokinase